MPWLLTFWIRLAFSEQLSSSRRSFSLSRCSLSLSRRTASIRARRLLVETAWAFTSASTPAAPSVPGHRVPGSGRKAVGTWVDSTLQRGTRMLSGVWQEWES